MFEWDPDKNNRNRRKHRISFADTFAVFEDSRALTLEDPTTVEERFITIGADCFGRVLVVVYAWRGETIRIISARRASKWEKMQYEGQL
jgi:uncharacterized DUF497 family protein